MWFLHSIISMRANAGNEFGTTNLHRPPIGLKIQIVNILEPQLHAEKKSKNNALVKSDFLVLVLLSFV